MGKKRIFWTIIAVLLAVISVRAVLAQSKTLSLVKLFASLREADPVWIVLAVICMIGFIYFEGAALLCITGAIGYKRSQFSGLIYSASDIYVSAITPSATGGQPASAYVMTRDGIPAGIVTVSLLVNLIMYTLAILTIGAGTFLLDAQTFWNFKSFPSRVLIIIGLVVLTGLVAVFILLLSCGRKVFQAVARIIRFLADHHIVRNPDKVCGRLEKTVEDYEACVAVMRGKKRALVSAYFLNLIQRISQILVSVMVYNAFYGCSAASGKVFSAQSMATIGFNCVPIPGAIGVADYLMIDGFKEILDREQAIHLEMISRGISFYGCMVLCGAAMLIAVIIYKHRKEEKRGDDRII